MFFTQPLWISILAPILLAPVLLIVSLVADPRRGDGFDTSVPLSLAGLALAFVMGGAPLAAVLVGFVLFSHRMALAIEQGRPAEASRYIGAAVIGQLLIVALMAALVTVVVTESPSRSAAAIVPFGVSYFAFHGISYVVDVYRRRVAASRSRCQLAVHLMLLPMVVGGPVAYHGVAPQLAHGWPSLSDYSYGVRRLLIGVWKVFVIADIAARQADGVFALRPVNLNAFAAWLGIISFTLQLYYAFSGYADMGLGLGRMVGLRMPENFRWPYVAQTVGEFWRRWHLGLTGWFRDYVSTWPNGEGVGSSAAVRDVFVVLLCGLWYGTGWTFVVWGVYHAALITMEHAGGEAAVKRLPRFLRHVYVLVIVMAGWVILRSRTLDGALLFFKALAGANGSVLRGRTTVETMVGVVLTAAAIGCAPVFQAVRRWTVVIDGLILSLLMFLFAPFLFAWRCGAIVVMPIVRWWRSRALSR